MVDLEPTDARFCILMPFAWILAQHMMVENFLFQRFRPFNPLSKLK